MSELERRPIRELLDDGLLDGLLSRSRDEAGGLRLTGEGSMLGELVKAVLEAELDRASGLYQAHPGQRWDDGERPEREDRHPAGGLRLTAEGWMLGDLAKAELEVELTAHLDYARHVQGEGVVAKNARNGKISEDPQDGADLGGPGGVASAAEPSRVVRAVLVPKRAGRV